MPAANNEMVRIPKWVMVLTGTIVSVVFSGLLAWLTSMNVAIQQNAIDIASIKAQVTGQTKSTDELKAAIDRLDDKLDRLLHTLTERQL